MLTKPLKYSLASVLLFLTFSSIQLFAVISEKTPTRILHIPLKEKLQTKQPPLVKKGTSLKKDTTLSELSKKPFTIPNPSTISQSTPDIENKSASDGYRINFTNVAITEYLRFVAKISGHNFVYQDDDLQFAVTIVSEEPTSITDITAALLQVLRIHGLTLSEQGNNILIYKEGSISRLGPVILEDSGAQNSYSTRVISLTNLPALKAQSIVTALLSPQALVDISASTNQLIITDINSNINTIIDLLTALDQPFDALDITTYTTRHGSATAIAEMASLILAPIAEIQGVSILIKGQPSGIIFIVAPIGFQEKIQQILEKIDNPASHLLTNHDVLVYIPVNLSPDTLVPLARQILQPIATTENVPFNITIQASTKSIFITSTKTFNQRVVDVLKSLDQPTTDSHLDLSAQSGPFEVATFKPQNMSPEALVSLVDQILQPIALTEKIPFSVVIQAATNSIYISSTRSFNLRTMQLLQQLDAPGAGPVISDIKGRPSTGNLNTEITTYLTKNADPISLVTVASKILDPLANLENVPFTMTLQSSTNTIYISSSKAFNIKAIDLLVQLDKPSITQNNDINQTTIIAAYLPKYSSPDTLLPIVEKILNPIAESEKIPFTMIIQPLTKTIYISSSHEFTLRTINLLKQLDQPAPEKAATPTAGKAITVEVASYQPQNLPADALMNVVQKIMEPIASSEKLPFTVVVQASTNSLFITSTASFNARVLSVLTALDQPSLESNLNNHIDLPPTNIDTTSFWLYKLQYQTGDLIQASLNTVGNNLQSYGGANPEIMDIIMNAVWLQSTNTLLFTGSESAIRRMQQLLPQIDVPSRQVYIEMLVITTTIQNSLNFGVQMGALVQTAQGMAYNFGSTTPLSASGSSTPGFSNSFQVPPTIGTTTSPSLPITPSFSLGSIGKFITHSGNVYGSIGSLVQALQTEGDTKIIINPKIVAVDNRQSSMFVGSNTPFTTANVTVQTAQQSNAFNVDYRDIGVSLQVTPTLGKGDIITLDLAQEIDQIDTGAASSVTQGFPTPTTTKLSTTTRVIIPNGYFLVLSGMIQNTKNYTKTGLPCLGCIPVLGAAFSTQTQTYTKNNTIIFIHPRIMETTDQICGIGNYEGDEFNWNSKPEECMPNCQTNAFHKSFYRPYESLSNDLPNGNVKGKSLTPELKRSTPKVSSNTYIPMQSITDTYPVSAYIQPETLEIATPDYAYIVPEPIKSDLPSNPYVVPEPKKSDLPSNPYVMPEPKKSDLPSNPYVVPEPKKSDLPSNPYVVPEPLPSIPTNPPIDNAYPANNPESSANNKLSFIDKTIIDPPLSPSNQSNNQKNPVQHIPKKAFPSKPPKRPMNE